MWSGSDMKKKLIILFLIMLLSACNNSPHTNYTEDISEDEVDLNSEQDNVEQLDNETDTPEIIINTASLPFENRMNNQTRFNNDAIYTMLDGDLIKINLDNLEIEILILASNMYESMQITHINQLIKVEDNFLYFTVHSRMYKFDLDTGAVEEVADLGKGGGGFIEVVDNSAYYTCTHPTCDYVAGGQGLHVLNMKEGEARLLIEARLIGDIFIHPEENRIVFVRFYDSENNYYLYQADLNGENQSRITSRELTVESQAAYDGETIFWSNSEGDMFSYHFASGEESSLGRFIPAFNLKLVDDYIIARHRNDNTVHLMRKDGSEVRELLHDGIESIRNIPIVVGNHIMFTSTENQHIQIFDLEGNLVFDWTNENID